MAEAKTFKEKGNQFYKEQKFEQALKCYIDASALQPKEPVYHSNISAVQFELGKYADSAASSDKALALINPLKSNAPLASKLLLRKAKALYYCSQFAEAKKALDQLSELCKQESISSLDPEAFLEKAIQHAETALSVQDAHELSIYKPTVDTRTPEYYIVGHDRPISALSGFFTPREHDVIRNHSAESDAAQKAFMRQQDLANSHRILMDKPTQDMYSIFYGGIGDARHLFTTLVDMVDTCTIDNNAKFHFTMVDHKPVVIARDLVLFYLFESLATFDVSRHTTDPAAIEITALLHYTYFGTAMPDYLHERLMNIIRELISDLEDGKLPPWLVVETNTIPNVLLYLDDWLNLKVDIKRMLKMTQSGLEKSMEDTIRQEAKNLNLPPEAADPLASMRQHMETMSDEELMSLPLPGATPKEKRENLKNLLANSDTDSMLKDTMMSLPGTGSELDSYKHIHVLFPPAPLLDRHPTLKPTIEGTYYIQRLMHHQLRGVSEEESERLAGPRPPKTDPDTTKAMREIYSSWKPNPTFWDKWWVEVIGEDEYEFTYNPVQTVYTIFDSMIAPPPVDVPVSSFDYSSPFFSRVAAALARFGNQMKLEWIAGDLYKTCSDIFHAAAERKEKDFPSTYDRMFLSNIPDYSGGNLSISIYITPLLKPLPHSFIVYNVLLNTAVFKNYEECVASYTLLPLAMSERYLGMKHIHGDLWGEDPKWTVVDTPLPHSKLVSGEELSNWLHRIFLHITLPPFREAMKKIRVDHPLNLMAFVDLLRRLAELGYPLHWLSGVLDSILSGKLKTKARPPPNSFNFHFAPAVISTKPFLDELYVALAANTKHFPFRPMAPIPTKYRHYSISPMAASPMYDLRASVLSILVAPKAECTNETMKGLREGVVNGEPNAILLTIIRWDSESCTMNFWLPEERMAQLQQDDWHAAAARTDCWMLIGKAYSLKGAVAR